MSKRSRLIILSFSVMVIIGFVNNIRGTLIPSIKFDLGISYGDIGLMLMISSLGFMGSTFLGGIASSKYGLKNVLYLGLISMGLGAILALYVSSFFILIIFIALIGIGAGLAEIGVNTLGTKIFIKKSGMMMNLMHLFFGIGASIGPRLAGLLLNQNWSWNKIYFSSLILLIAIIIYLFFTSFPENIETKQNKSVAISELIKNKKAWLFILVLGFSITAEIGTGNWLVNYLEIEHGFTTASGSFYLSLFFITFTSGRLLGGYLTEILGYLRTITYFSILTLIFYIIGLFLQNTGAILFSLSGFFISIMFPTIMAIIMQEFKENTGSYMGFIVTGASAINMLSNWLIGKTTELFGVYIGFASITFYITLLIIFLFLLNKILYKTNNKYKNQQPTI